MSLWRFIVPIGFGLGSVPLLFGPAIVIPVLGHATWHLYGAVILPNCAVPTITRRRCCDTAPVNHSHRTPCLDSRDFLTLRTSVRAASA
jgi:hypothetical protein